MSEPNRPRRSVRGERRGFSSVVLVGGAVLVAAILSAAAAALTTVASNNGPPTISGTAVETATLTSSSGSWSGTPPFAFEYAWLRCDTGGASCALIAGATAQSYALTDSDVGSTIRVQVTATDSTGPPASTAESPPTAVVTAAEAPVSTGEPTISGTPTEGVALTTTNGTWTGTEPIAFAYQWVRCGADGGASDGSNCTMLTGATAASYTPTITDAGGRLRVRVTASNAKGSATAASNPTDAVTLSTTTGPPRTTVEPSITGTLTIGRLLTASVGTWAGATPITYAYQWVRCGADGGAADGSNCTAIPGATSSFYSLAADDVGQRLRIRITATNSAGVQTAASNATAAVQSGTTAPPSAPLNSRLPTIFGTAALGQTMTANVGTWTGTAPIVFSYQWRRCGADGGQSNGSDCAAISGATGTQYVAASADVGQRLRVQVTARNTLGITTATSDATTQVLSTAPPPTTTPPPPTTGLPPGAIRLPDGKISIPVSSVSPPERLLASYAVFTPNPVRSRSSGLELRVRVLDTRGYVVRDALVFARSTPLLTSAPGELRSGRDGWVRFRMTLEADFPLGGGQNVQFWIRARKQSDELLEGVSNRRLVQVATAG
jgi:hypothetical protein